jgi:hypothetical protein
MKILSDDSTAYNMRIAKSGADDNKHQQPFRLSSVVHYDRLCTIIMGD